MNLLIVRHGIAEDKREFAKTGKSDDLRPLTAEGRTKMTHSADGLREIVPEISLLATSPFVRARESAEILAHAYGIEIKSTPDVLTPDGSFDEFVEWAGDRAEQDVLTIVGHEPHLSTLATWLISGGSDSRIELKKGGACLLTFDGAPTAGTGTLDWLLHPSHLRAIAARR